MAETASGVQSAAEGLIKWDKRRSLAAKILGFDVTIGYKTTNEAALAQSFGDFRAIISSMVASKVERATDKFCEAVAAGMGANRLPPEEYISPDRLTGGHPRDPLIQFPNGLILRSVDAAAYTLETGEPSTGSQDSLQTP